MVKDIKIGLLGFGTVGSGVARVLKENAHEIEQKVGTSVTIKKVLVRDKSKKREYLDDLYVTDDINEIINDDEIDIVVELMGGLVPAHDYMLKAIAAGKHVVTANKDVLAENGRDLLETAQKNHVEFMFEASVGGGIPIITPLKECLTANRITEIIGIVNGTTNYMLTKMMECGASYDDVLREAQEKGYAEANPTADVEGLDAARKAAILASLGFNTRVSLDNVAVEGITHITPEDIDYARQLGYVIKLLAIAKDSPEHGVDVRVHPTFLKKDHPLSSVNGVFNAIFVKGNAIGEAMFYGKGAGSLPTASAVIADIVSVSRDIVRNIFRSIGCTCYETKKFCPLADTESDYYIRLLVADEPGVLGKIATTFGDQGVSLKSVIQTRVVDENAEIVVITHHVEHKKIEKAESVLKNLPVVTKISNVIRVERTLE